jgi:hypothetical protein
MDLIGGGIRPLDMGVVLRSRFGKALETVESQRGSAGALYVPVGI